MEPFSSIGGAPFLKDSPKAIRLILKGCVNRPFFHISIQEVSKREDEPVIEQLGNYDPLPNKYNEKLIAINFQRLEYWLRQGANPTVPVQKLLGLCGYFPIHPESFTDAYLRRKQIMTELEKLKIKAAEFSSMKSEETDKSSQDVSSNSVSSGSKDTLEKDIVSKEFQPCNDFSDGESKK